MDRILGIDPGLGGGLALIARDGELGGVWDMPTVRLGKGQRRDYDLVECWDLARKVDAELIVLEQLQPMPRNGSIACFALGRGLMLWESIAVGLSTRLERIRPKRWQQILDVPQGERASLARAREMWPSAELQRAKHSGRAAALCIAEAGRRVLR